MKTKYLCLRLESAARKLSPLRLVVTEMVFNLYYGGLVVIGLAILGIVLLPRIVSEQPLSQPILYVGLGAIAFSLPIGLTTPDPLIHGEIAKRVTELGVIVALMSAGLKLNRPPGLRAWASTWRLLALTMPLSIAGAAVLGWGLAGFFVPTAVLFGAVIAPTDPVLASEVQVEQPGEGVEDEELAGKAGKSDEVRFALTGEAGLNDGLAFPFTNAAIAIALVGVAPEAWFSEWLLVDVGYRIIVGTILGVGTGWVLSKLVFRLTAETPLAKAVTGLESLGGTLLIYGLTEIVGGYGFIAVFVAALTIRHSERSHEYNEQLHEIAEKSEQVLMALIMVLFGGALATGLLSPLTREAVAVAFAVVFLIRPLAGFVGLLGFDREWSEQATIAFFGIRGIGSFYYLAYALEGALFEQAELLWATVGLIVLISVLVHGVTATPVVKRLG